MARKVNGSMSQLVRVGDTNHLPAPSNSAGLPT